MSSLAVVVLCSGRGSNLQALIDAQADGSLSIDIRAVVSDKPQCHALERARLAGIATCALRARDFSDRAAFDTALFDEVARCSPQLVICAGYMRIIDSAVVQRWVGRMINIHPSLLPKYPGLHTHQRALDAGDTLHGASLHFVTPDLDGGPVIAQVQVPIHVGDDAAALACRLLRLEHHLLIASVRLIATGQIALADDAIVYRSQTLASPLQLDAHGQLASS